MNAILIKKALDHYLADYSAGMDTAELVDTVTALEELACVQDMRKDADLFKNGVTLIPDEAWMDILIGTTYDILGRLMRVHAGIVHPSYYVHNVRANVSGMELIPTRYILEGYYLCRDLWLDNEANGDHGEDGTFKANK